MTHPETRPVLWSGDDLRVLLGLEGTDIPDVTGISIDSRTLEPGDLFVALAGDDARYRGAGGGGRDGHEFLDAAATAGAAAALVARDRRHGRGSAALAELAVPDPFDALWILARAARARMTGPVFAITGSSGKTTAKAMLGAALAALTQAPHAAAGSFNNHIGVPLSLARMPATASAAVFEVGMNSPGEIAPLSRLIAPDVALVLNVLPVHLEGLGSLEAIRREKLSIAAGLGPEGVLVVHEPIDLGDEAVRGRVVRFGTGAEADVRLSDDGLGMTISLPDGRRLQAPTAAEGPHRRLTACAVLAMLWAADLDVEAALGAVAASPPPPGRGAVRRCGGVRIIDDSYNANPDSVRHALDGLREGAARRRFALLGDMLELGPDERALHAGLARACEGLDGVFCVGERARALFDALPESLAAGWWPDCEALAVDMDVLRARLGPQDALLVKASNRLFWKHGTVATLCACLEGAR
ncbi:MAG TPA: UDP-N-acetylmuramoyl-tripeptide--D-alanyl-D-alanine ligase [Pseudomonadales bacterium]|nr:UDP-N-acetylmuramoyl-tripeptide--D-alanyl-D-alanine ligase [Pseudomonadales bacterium]